MKKLIDATKRNTVSRPFCVPTLLDFDKSVNEGDKKSLMAQSRHAYSNNPLVRAVLQQRSMFSTKHGWQFQSLVTDKAWKEQAELYFDKFSKVACVTGMDFQTLIYQLCISIDVNGDGFVLLTESKNGFPQLQFIPAHRIGTRNNSEVITSGKYKGLKVISGVIVSKVGRPIAYNVLADEEANDKIIDAKDIVHFFDPESAESVRGIPLVSHTLRALSDLQESRDAELTAQKMFAKTALIEKLGQEDDTAAFLNGTCDSPNANNVPLYEEFNDGDIVVYRSQNSDLKALETNRPSMNHQTYRQTIMQEIITSLNWSSSLLDGYDKTSVENRINIRVAEISVSDRIALLTPGIKRIAFYVLSKGIINGDLPAIENYWNMTFSRPPFISADMSKIENSTRENLRMGITTLSDILEADGKNLETHLRQKFTEQAMEQLIKAEIESKYGVSLTPSEI